ncbi:MAG: hypothetical protein K2I64_05000 [Muribaculaceae bacterium]|nr:hypothetical protein [Muribaculaceae bacterium]
MKRFLLFIVLLLSIVVGRAETWTPVGQVQWTEGALTGKQYVWGGIKRDLHQTWSTIIERSDSRSGVFRMQPYANDVLRSVTSSVLGSENVYVYLHIENPEQVYLDYYIRPAYISGNVRHYFHVWQKCPENGFDSKYYGKIIDNAIVFPVGSFLMDDLTDGSNKTKPSSLASSSRFEHVIEFPNGIPDYTPTPETWVKIGQGYWVDPFWYWTSNDSPVEKNIEIEKSVQHPDRYRTKVFNDAEYISINVGDPNKVYISPYSHENSTGTIMTVTQNCAENGMSGSKYGTLSSGKITIPGDCFVSSSTSGNYATCSSSRKCEITFPEGFDNPLAEDNGVFMGIIGFNDEINRKPLSLLSESTKGDFTSFVNELQMGNATLLY